MEKFINKHKNLFIILLVSIAMILFVVFYFLLLDDDNYNYKHIKGNSYTANDNSYLVLNNDKTFYWYKDKNDKNNYYYGSYTVKRGENAVKFISSDLVVYDITEEAQRQTIENIDIENAIDHYYLLNLNNEKLVKDGKEEKMYKETRYYGFATDDYNELDFLNVDADNYAIFIIDK